MSRREYTTLVKGIVLIWTGLATTFLAGVLSIAFHATGYSGESKKPIHIGVISFAEPALRTDLDQSLIQGLREQGYVEGVNLTIEWRYADGYEAAFRILRDLAGMKLDAIVTTCTPTTRAVAAAATKTPIVMAGGLGSNRPGAHCELSASRRKDYWHRQSVRRLGGQDVSAVT